MWDLPGPGLEHTSPALAGGFPTTAPPGKSQPSKYLDFISYSSSGRVSTQVLQELDGGRWELCVLWEGPSGGELGPWESPGGAWVAEEYLTWW